MKGIWKTILSLAASCMLCISLSAEAPKNASIDEAIAPDGQVMDLVITEVTEESITVDANHPLAGQALSFDIELVEIA